MQTIFILYGYNDHMPRYTSDVFNQLKTIDLSKISVKNNLPSTIENKVDLISILNVIGPNNWWTFFHLFNYESLNPIIPTCLSFNSILMLPQNRNDNALDNNYLWWNDNESINESIQARNYHLCAAFPLEFLHNIFREAADASWFAWVLKELGEYGQKFLILLGDEFIEEIISNNADLLRVLESLPQKDRLEFLLKFLKDGFLKKTMKDFSQLLDVLELLKPEECLSFLKSVDQAYLMSQLMDANNSATAFSQTTNNAHSFFNKNDAINPAESYLSSFHKHKDEPLAILVLDYALTQCLDLSIDTLNRHREEIDKIGNDFADINFDRSNEARSIAKP